MYICDEQSFLYAFVHIFVFGCPHNIGTDSEAISHLVNALTALPSTRRYPEVVVVKHVMHEARPCNGLSAILRPTAEWPIYNYVLIYFCRADFS